MQSETRDGIQYEGGSITLFSLLTRERLFVCGNMFCGNLCGACLGQGLGREWRRPSSPFIMSRHNLNKWNAQQIEDYLARFNVEEAVQLAINSAIATKAPDPIMHIADFLEAKGLEIELAHAAEAADAGRSAEELPPPPLPLPPDQTRPGPSLVRRAATASDSELDDWAFAAPPP